MLGNSDASLLERLQDEGSDRLVSLQRSPMNRLFEFGRTPLSEPSFRSLPLPCLPPMGQSHDFSLS